MSKYNRQAAENDSKTRFNFVLPSYLKRNKVFFVVALVCITLTLYFLRPELTRAQFPAQQAEFLKVTNRVYCATGYALGNVIYIITDKSVVVVDTTESQSAARATFEKFRKVSQLPVSYIIYTHHHGDHINGAKVFKGETTKIIAQKRFVQELANYRQLLPYNRRVNAVQFGVSLPPAERGVRLATNISPKGTPGQQELGYLPPDILFDEKYSFEEGGVRFELYHTLGETFDHLMVWMPQEQVLLPGDLFYNSFPMLSSPMKPVRPVQEWAESLERMRQLQPAYLVPSHTKPLKGRTEIDSVLANYAKAIRYVHDETVKGINQGLTLEQMRQKIRLPDELARLPYLTPVYGRVEWSVNGIYSKYTGWYDFNPSHLNPGPVSTLHRALIEASGSSGSLVRRSQKALKDNQPQLALEITNVILDAEPNNSEAKALRVQALEKLAKETINIVEPNIYFTEAQVLKKKLFIDNSLK